MSKIRIGIFGVGFRGKTVGRGGSLIASVEASGAEVVAICDSNPAHLQFCKEDKFPDREVGLYTSFDQFITHDMDAVMLCNYFHQHADYAIRALRAGKHVLCETTSNITMAEGVRLVRACEESGCTFALLENYPYFKSNQEMARLAKGGTLGPIIYAEGEYVHPGTVQSGNNLAPGIYHWRNWLPRTYYLTHSLAPLLYMTDAMPTRVTAMASFQGNYIRGKGSASHAADNSAVLMIQTDSNTILRVTGCAHWGYHNNYYRLCGINGAVDTDRRTGEIQLHYNAWSTPEGAEGDAKYEPGYESPELGELAKTHGHGGGDFFAIYNFVKALENGTEPYWNVYRATAMASCAILGWRSILNGSMGFEVPDFRREEDKCRYEYDDATPFPDENGHVNSPCSSQPYEPSAEDIAAAMKDWEETGVAVSVKK